MIGQCYTIIAKGERKELKMTIEKMMEMFDMTREEVEEVLFS